MSFTDSPVVRIDGLDRRWEQGLVALSIPLAALLPWLQSARDVDASFKVAAAAIFVLLTAVAWRAFGWLGGPRSIVRAVWLADGTWQLEFRDGRSDPGCLDATTRLLPPIALLVWQTPRGRCCVLVRRRSGDVTFRRLASRLRFVRNRPRSADEDVRGVT